MLVRALQRLPWQLTCALFAFVATADIQPSTSNTGISYDGTITLQIQGGQNLSTLEPISTEATSRNLDGELFLTTDSTFNNISSMAIAYISCNPDDYTGLIKAQDVLKGAYENNITGAILYSTATDYCNYTDSNDNQQAFPMYSMTKTSDSQTVLSALESQPVAMKYFVNVLRSDQRGRGSGNGNGNDNTNPAGNQNPLGPSPSTAVAMIILYSITGIITALFLVIIVTGAVRAHRHPDRYGPRDVLGRPRQSRARGLGRAILDTLPIVKFGEREPPKPTDVELGSTSEARDVNANAAAATQDARSSTEARADGLTEPARDEAAMESGIAPAQPMAAGATSGHDDPASEEGLGCSICTEDFEKGQDIRVLPCNHKFHPDCVDPWLLNVSGTCPLCRVDLRPVTSHTSTEDDHLDPDHLAPPLQSENDVSHRRRSALRDILSFRARPDASADERISALRRLREQRRNQSGDVSANGSSDDVADRRRSKRMSVRLSSVFGGGRRGREESPAPGESSSTAPQQQPRRDESPGLSASRGELPPPNENAERRT